MEIFLFYFNTFYYNYKFIILYTMYITTKYYIFVTIFDIYIKIYIYVGTYIFKRSINVIWNWNSIRNIFFFEYNIYLNRYIILVRIL